MSGARPFEEALWRPYEGGRTLGKRGTENGAIRRDEEHIAGARITLEDGAIGAPFAVTCGIYGVFVHTALAADEAEGVGKYLAMRQRLEEIITLPDAEVTMQLRAFVEQF